MARHQSELIDTIDLLQEVEGLLEASFLAAAGLANENETRAMQAVIGKSTDVLKMAIEYAQAALEVRAGK